MKKIGFYCAFLVSAVRSLAAEPPPIEVFDGARFMFVGASWTDHHRWPAYFAAYFSLRYPQYTLHYAMDARGGTNITRMFGSGEPSPNLSDKNVHLRTVRPWGADYVFIQYAKSGGFDPEEDALHRQTYIEEYLEPDGMVPVLINGWQNAEPIRFTQVEREQNAVNALAIEYGWNSSVIFEVTNDRWGESNGFSYAADPASNVLTAVGHTFVNGMRVRLGRKNGDHAHPLEAPPTDYFVRDVDGDRLKLALTKGGPAVDITSQQTGDLRISREWALLNGHDRDHLGVPGYMALFKYMMDSLGLDTSVSQATIDAAAVAVVEQNQCVISNLARNRHGGVDFDRLDNRLPYVLDDDWWDDAVELEPELLTHQDYSITVSGLSKGDYEVRVNDVVIGVPSAAELASGWNMAALQSGPVFDKGKEVLGRIRDAQGRVRASRQVNAILPSTSPRSGFEGYRAKAATSFDVEGNRGTAHLAALAPEREALDAMDDLIRAAAQPEVLRFSIRATEERGISRPKGGEAVPER